MKSEIAKGSDKNCIVIHSSQNESNSEEDSATSTTIGESIVSSNRKKRRTYLDSYLKYGFYYCGDTNDPKPWCLLCEKILSNNSMKPSLLQRHLKTNHANFDGKSPEFFAIKKEKSWLGALQ